MRLMRVTLPFIVVATALFVLWNCYWRTEAAPLSPSQKIEGTNLDLVQETLRGASEMKMGFGSECSQLPNEFCIFERLEKLRSMGCEPAWRDFKYILRDSSTKKDFDPFLLDSRLRRSMTGEMDSQLLRGLTGKDLCPERLTNKFYYLYQYGLHIELRDNKPYVTGDAEKNHIEVTAEQICVRDAAILFNFGFWWNGKPWWGGIRPGTDEVTLKEHGFIMKKEADVYFPVNLKTGKRLELGARQYMTTNALQMLNAGAKEFGKDFFSNHDLFTIIGGGCPPVYEGLTAKIMLELYEVPVQWNETTQRYEIGGY